MSQIKQRSFLKKLKTVLIYNYPFVKLSLINTFNSLYRPAEKKPASSNKILMLTISQIEIDSRINKTAKSLAENGYEVTIVTYHTQANQENYKIETIANGISYLRVNHPKHRRFFNGFIQHDFITAAKQCQFDFVHANDLTTIITGWMLARQTGCRFIYDSHELWSDNVAWNGKQYIRMQWWKRFLSRFLEKKLLNYVDSFFTVSPSIVQEYKQNFKKKPHLLANFPDVASLSKITSDNISIRNQCGLTEEHFITLYLGGVGPARNIETVIKAHQLLDERFVFVIRGPSVDRYGQEYLNLAKSLGIAHKIFLLPAVARDDIIAAANGADCGVVMLKNLCKNFYWFYPNKFFEYSLAALPVAVSNFPDVSEHIKKERNGVTFEPSDAKSIATAILFLANNLTEARAMGQRGKNSILREYNWGKAVQVMINEYKRLS